MTDAGTLATTAQVLLAIGEDASATQILEANTNYWILYAESEMEKEFGKLGQSPGLVANYAIITASYKQWLASIAANRAAFHGINQNQNSWQLATAQSKLNVCNSIWEDFINDIKSQSSEIVSQMGL